MRNLMLFFGAIVVASLASPAAAQMNYVGTATVGGYKLQVRGEQTITHQESPMPIPPDALAGPLGFAEVTLSTATDANNTGPQVNGLVKSALAGRRGPTISDGSVTCEYVVGNQGFTGPIRVEANWDFGQISTLSMVVVTYEVIPAIGLTSQETRSFLFPTDRSSGWFVELNPNDPITFTDLKNGDRVIIKMRQVLNFGRGTTTVTASTARIVIP